MGVDAVIEDVTKVVGSAEKQMNFSPLPAELAPRLTRIGYFFKLWALKLFVALYLAVFRYRYPSPKTQPTLIRIYACRPSLPVRIFMPPQSISDDKKTPNPGIKSTLLPLYLDIHGSAFAVGDASLDDSFCTSWARRTGMLVVSLNYHKTPLHAFPVAVHDVAALVSAVIDDSSLPVDKTRVIIAGFSAGGNLALTSSLLPNLSGKIKAVVSYYPIVDWSSNPQSKFAGRLYKDEKRESLADFGPMLDWAYVPAFQDRRDELLSPCYADRKALPPFICMVAAQHDMLCREARDMIYSLAGRDMPSTAWDEGFEDEHYKWVLVMGVRHGFTDDLRRRGVREDKRREICERLYDDVHRWLVRNVL